VLFLDDAAVTRVRDGFNAVATTIGALRKVITDHNGRGGAQLFLPPMPLDAMLALRSFVKEVTDSGYRQEAPAEQGGQQQGSGR